MSRRGVCVMPLPMPGGAQADGVKLKRDEMRERYGNHNSIISTPYPKTTNVKRSLGKLEVRAVLATIDSIVQELACRRARYGGHAEPPGRVHSHPAYRPRLIRHRLPRRGSRRRQHGGRQARAARGG